MLKLPMGWAAANPGMITSPNSKPMRSAFFIQQALRPHWNVGWKKHFPIQESHATRRSRKNESTNRNTYPARGSPGLAPVLFVNHRRRTRLFDQLRAHRCNRVERRGAFHDESTRPSSE